jgi:hypothetical protein
MITLQRKISNISLLVVRVKLVVYLAFAIMILTPQIMLAQEDPWFDSLRNTKGMSVGTLGPRYPELEKKKPAEPTGTGEEPDVMPVEEPEGEIPLDPNRLDPHREDMAANIREWVSVAEPPENAIEGNNFHYSNKGNIIGTAAGGLPNLNRNPSATAPDAMGRSRA